MTKGQLKQIIKECIKEVLNEEINSLDPSKVKPGMKGKSYDGVEYYVAEIIPMTQYKRAARFYIPKGNLAHFTPTSWSRVINDEHIIAVMKNMGDDNIYAYAYPSEFTIKK